MVSRNRGLPQAKAPAAVGRPLGGGQPAALCVPALVVVLAFGAGAGGGRGGQPEPLDRGRRRAVAGAEGPAAAAALLRA